SGLISNKSKTWSSISRCCAVTHTLALKKSSSANALTNGAIFIASGLVPKIDNTFIKTPQELAKYFFKKFQYGFSNKPYLFISEKLESTLLIAPINFGSRDTSV